MSFTPNAVSKPTMALPDFIKRLDMLFEQRAKFALDHYGVKDAVTLLLPSHRNAGEKEAVKALATDYYDALHYRKEIEEHYKAVGWGCCKLIESGEDGESPGLVAIRLCKLDSTDCCDGKNAS